MLSLAGARITTRKGARSLCLRSPACTSTSRWYPHYRSNASTTTANIRSSWMQTLASPVRVQSTSLASHVRVQSTSLATPVRVQSTSLASPVRVQSMSLASPVRVQSTSLASPVRVQSMSLASHVRVQSTSLASPVRVQAILPARATRVARLSCIVAIAPVLTSFDCIRAIAHNVHILSPCSHARTTPCTQVLLRHAWNSHT